MPRWAAQRKRGAVAIGHVLRRRERALGRCIRGLPCAAHDHGGHIDGVIPGLAQRPAGFARRGADGKCVGIHANFIQTRGHPRGVCALQVGQVGRIVRGQNGVKPKIARRDHLAQPGGPRRLRNIFGAGGCLLEWDQPGFKKFLRGLMAFVRGRYTVFMAM